MRNNQPSQSFQPGQTVTPTTQQTPYEVDASDTAEDNEIDLHNKEFCVDVSSYQPVVWEEKPGESCTTEMRMMCEDKREEVCEDISETRCDVSSF